MNKTTTKDGNRGVWWYSTEDHLYAVVDNYGEYERWRWSQKSGITDGEAWVFDVPDEAKPYDAFFVHDHCEWWIDYIYCPHLAINRLD